LEDKLAVEKPMLVIGIGGAGSRIANDVSNTIDYERILISNDRNDLIGNRSILINSKSWVNPSSYKLRFYAQDSLMKIRTTLREFKTVILIANLAGKAGSAIAPMV